MGETLVPFALVAAAAVIGVLAWRGDPRLLPLAMLFPALWSAARSRVTALLVSAAYFLAASRGLPQGIATFFSRDLLTGIVLWLVASTSFVFVHTALWTGASAGRRAVRYALAMILMAIPPFGIAGWAHPITAAGVIFPERGWAGMLASFVLLTSLVLGRRWVPIMAFLGLWGVGVCHWQQPTMPGGWVGLDTHFRDIFGAGTAYAVQAETIALVKAAVAHGPGVAVLPESAAGQWTDTVEHLWAESLKGTHTLVVLGATLVTRHGYDNVLMAVTAAGGHVVYRERMPVPVSMWRPWDDWMGSGGGTRADFFANPSMMVAGRRAAPLICYEQLIVWPVLQSMLHKPDLIIGVGNGWWADGTSIIAIQRASIEAWARLFGLPLVLASNT